MDTQAEHLTERERLRTAAAGRQADGTEAEKTLAPPPFQLKASDGLPVQRQAAVTQFLLEYTEQIRGEQEAQLLQAFDQALVEMETRLETAEGEIPENLPRSLEALQRLRREGKVTVWRMTGGRVFALYDAGSGEIRLNFNFPQQAVNISTLMHEGIHAVHAGDHPAIFRRYARFLARGGRMEIRNETELQQALEMLRLRAWTEYWAIRGQSEFSSLRVGPAEREDPHEQVMRHHELVPIIRQVETVGGQAFDPRSWNPPGRRRRRP